MDIARVIGVIVGALILGGVAADRSGHWFFGIIIGMFAGLMIVAALQGAKGYLKEAATDPTTRASHKHIYITVGSFVVAVIVYVGLLPDEVVLPPIPQVAQPVEVSGYTRSDGARVGSYDRALPRERARNNQRVADWVTAGGRRMDAYRSERTTAFLWALGVFGLGCFWAYKVRNHAG
jgi:hypothetical protein